MTIPNWVTCITGPNLHYDAYTIDRLGCWMWAIGFGSVLEEVKVFVAASAGQLKKNPARYPLMAMSNLLLVLTLRGMCGHLVNLRIRM